MEFVVAIVPLLVAFFCLVQLAKLYSAKIVLDHAAITASRAAIVILPPNPDAPRDPAKGQRDVTRAAELAMGPWKTSRAFTKVSIDARGPSEPYGMTTVRVTATYRCSVPLGGRIVCGLGGTKTMTSEASLPNQGARYKRRKPRGRTSKDRTSRDRTSRDRTSKQRRRTSACEPATVRRLVSHRLVADTRGAVMLTSIFAACFLVGGLWFIVGTTDAIVHRQRMQEAADAVAFSAAATQARGMNFLSAMNLILVALAAIYVIYRATQALCHAGIFFTGLPPGTSSTDYPGIAESNRCELKTVAGFFAGGAGLCPVATLLHQTRRQLETQIQMHYQLMDKVVPGISNAETVVASILTPVGSEIASIVIAAKYGRFGLSLSSSVLPGGAASSALIEDDEERSREVSSTDQKMIGLPVARDKMQTICHGLAGWSVEKAVDGTSVFLGPARHLPPIRSAVDEVKSLADRHAKEDWCGGAKNRWWKTTDGPVKVWSRAENGSSWMQSYGVIVDIEKKDPNERMVAFATGDSARERARYTQAIGKSGGTLRLHVAQSEMYFDCNDTWEGRSCNGGHFGAMYGMRWRARLVRVRNLALLARMAGPVKEVIAVARHGLAIAEKALGGALDLGEQLRLVDGRVLRDGVESMDKAARGALDAADDVADFGGDQWVH